MNKLSTMIEDSLVLLDTDADSRDGLLMALSGALVAAGVVDPAALDGLTEALRKREALASTALGNGVAVPHAYVDFIGRDVLAFARTRSPVPFGPSGAQNSDLFVLLAGPSRKAAEHLQLLARVARMARDDRFLSDLRAASTPAQVAEAFSSVEKRHR